LIVQAKRVWVVVSVSLDLQAAVLHDRNVVAPGGVGNVARRALTAESAHKRTSDPKCASAGDALRRHETRN
jgi:hypothetical protein